ncbi:unnamed protein product [Lampetra fluviatilis]
MIEGRRKSINNTIAVPQTNGSAIRPDSSPAIGTARQHGPKNQVKLQDVVGYAIEGLRLLGVIEGSRWSPPAFSHLKGADKKITNFSFHFHNLLPPSEPQGAASAPQPPPPPPLDVKPEHSFSGLASVLQTVLRVEREGQNGQRVTLKLEDVLLVLRGVKGWNTILAPLHETVRTMGQARLWERLSRQVESRWLKVAFSVAQAFSSSSPVDRGMVEDLGSSLRGFLCVLFGDKHPEECGPLASPLEGIIRSLISSQTWSNLSSFLRNNLKVDVRGDPVGFLEALSRAVTSSGDLQLMFNTVTPMLSILGVQGSTLQAVSSAGRFMQAVLGYDTAEMDNLRSLPGNLMDQIGTRLYRRVVQKMEEVNSFLLEEAASTLGMQHQQDPRQFCQEADLRQLLLWGVMNNITWDHQGMGFSLQDLLSLLLFAACDDDALSESPHQNTRDSLAKGPRSASKFFENDQAQGQKTVKKQCGREPPYSGSMAQSVYCSVFSAVMNDANFEDAFAACRNVSRMSDMSENFGIVYTCGWVSLVRFNESICNGDGFSEASTSPGHWLQARCSYLQREKVHGGTESGFICDNILWFVKPFGFSVLDFCFDQSPARFISAICSYPHPTDYNVSVLVKYCNQESNVTTNSGSEFFVKELEEITLHCRDLNVVAKRNFSYNVVEICNVYMWWAVRNVFCANNSLLDNLQTDLPWLNAFCGSPQAETTMAHLVANMSTGELSAHSDTIKKFILRGFNDTTETHFSVPNSTTIASTNITQGEEALARGLDSLAYNGSDTYHGPVRRNRLPSARPRNASVGSKNARESLPGQDPSVKTCVRLPSLLKNLVSLVWSDGTGFAAEPEITTAWLRLATEDIGQQLVEDIDEAIFLLSLLSSNAFQAYAKPTASLSILQSISGFLHSVPPDKGYQLLSCFGGTLWNLMFYAENSSEILFLLQEYLRLPSHAMETVLFSSDDVTVRYFLSELRQAWHDLSVEERSEHLLKPMVGSLLRRFHNLTEDIFLEMVQLLPYLSPADITALPAALLESPSVLTAALASCPALRKEQRQALARHVARRPGGVAGWSPQLLESLAPLLTSLPISYFVQLTDQQVLSVVSLLDSSSADTAHWRHVSHVALNGNTGNLTERDVHRFGRVLCYTNTEDLAQLMGNQPVFRSVLQALISCIEKGAIDIDGKLAFFIAKNLGVAEASELTQDDLAEMAYLLPALGLAYTQQLPSQLVQAGARHINSITYAPAQARVLAEKFIHERQLTAQVVGQLGSLVCGLPPSVLRTLPPAALTQGWPAVRPHAACLRAAQRTAIISTFRRSKMDCLEWIARLGPLLSDLPLVDLDFRYPAHAASLPALADINWTPHQAQSLFRRILKGHSGELKKEFILSLGTVFQGVDCETLMAFSQDPEFLGLVHHLLLVAEVVRTSLCKCIVAWIENKSEITVEEIILMGPQLVMELPMKTLSSFPSKAFKMAVDIITQNQIHFLNLEPSKQRQLTKTILEQMPLPTVVQIGGEYLDSLGFLVGFMEEEVLRRMSRPELLLRLGELHGYCLPAPTLDALGLILTQNDALGGADMWSLATVEQLGRLVLALPLEDIYQLPKEVLSMEVVEFVLRAQWRWEANAVGRACTRRLGERARLGLLSKARALAERSSHMEHGQRGAPTCADIKATFPAVWTPGQLVRMSGKDFYDCLETLGADEYLSPEQLTAIMQRVGQLHGGAARLPPTMIQQLGRAATRLTPRELLELDLTDPAALASLGALEGWDRKQLVAGFRSFVQRSGSSVAEMDSTDLVMLGHFICGMTPTDISRINARQYSRAALAIGRLSLRCTEAQLNSLVKVAMSSSAFGLPSNWGLEVFTEIGSVAVGLPDVVLSALVKEQIEGLTSTAIAIMPPRKFAVVFEVSSLQHFTAAQAEAVTDEQLEQLSPLQRHALLNVRHRGEAVPDGRGRSSGRLLRSLTPMTTTLLVALCLY